MSKSNSKRGGKARRRAPASETAAGKPAARWYLPVVMLVLAGVVVVAMIVMIARDTPEKPPVSQQPTDSLASKTVASARGLMGFRRFGEAIGLMEAYLRQSPDDTTVRPLLIEAQLGDGRPAEAEKTVDRLLQLAPHSPDGLWFKAVLLRRRGDEAHAEWLQRAGDTPEARPEALAALASMLIQNGDLQGGEQYLRRALARWPKHAEILRELGKLAARRKDFKAAADYFARGVAGRTPDAGELEMLGMAQKDAGQYAAAAVSLGRAVEVSRGADRTRRRFRFAEALWLAGRKVRAADAFARSADEDRSGSHAIALRTAKCYHLLGKYALAMKYIDRASILAPGASGVVQWRKRIEDARFPRTEPADTTPFLTPLKKAHDNLLKGKP